MRKEYKYIHITTLYILICVLVFLIFNLKEVKKNNLLLKSQTSYLQTQLSRTKDDRLKEIQALKQAKKQLSFLEYELQIKNIELDKMNTRLKALLTPYIDKKLPKKPSFSYIPIQDLEDTQEEIVRLLTSGRDRHAIRSDVSIFIRKNLFSFGSEEAYLKTLLGLNNIPSSVLSVEAKAKERIVDLLQHSRGLDTKREIDTSKRSRGEISQSSKGLVRGHRLGNDIIKYAKQDRIKLDKLIKYYTNKTDENIKTLFKSKDSSIILLRGLYSGMAKSISYDLAIKLIDLVIEEKL
jgi:hypothetical protein